VTCDKARDTLEVDGTSKRPLRVHNHHGKNPSDREPCHFRGDDSPMTMAIVSILGATLARYLVYCRNKTQD
ncbi:unnamed protein product, partial [Ilex paraguariensis]